MSAVKLKIEGDSAILTMDLQKIFPNDTQQQVRAVLHPATQKVMLARLMFIMAADLSGDEASRWAEGYERTKSKPSFIKGGLQ